MNGCLKGKENERRVCRLLSEWWYGVSYKDTPANELPFHRTMGSGSCATFYKKHNRGAVVDNAGDVSIPDDFPFCIEIKKQESWDFDQYFRGSKWDIFGWWDKLLVDSKVKNKKPMLIISKNRFPDMVFVGLDFAESLKEETHIPPVYIEMGYDESLNLAEGMIYLFKFNRFCRAYKKK